MRPYSTCKSLMSLLVASAAALALALAPSLVRPGSTLFAEEREHETSERVERAARQLRSGWAYPRPPGPASAAIESCDVGHAPGVPRVAVREVREHDRYWLPRRAAFAEDDPDGAASAAL